LRLANLLQYYGMRSAYVCGCALSTTWPRFCKNYALIFSMLDETGFYAPSMAHNTLPCLPWQGISVFHGIILTEI
jgi:hypothetical protein